MTMVRVKRFHVISQAARLIGVLLILSSILLGCSRMPDHAPVPDSATFVIRNPSQGTRPRGNCCDIYTEKYVSSQSPEEVLAFYKGHNLSCKDFSASPQTEEFQSTIWICIGDLSEDVTLYAYVMPQETMEEDIRQFEASGDSFSGLPMEPESTDPPGETVIVAEVELEID
jgi:hypothetical protein